METPITPCLSKGWTNHRSWLGAHPLPYVQLWPPKHHWMFFPSIMWGGKLGEIPVAIGIVSTIQCEKHCKEIHLPIQRVAHVTKNWWFFINDNVMTWCSYRTQSMQTLVCSSLSWRIGIFLLEQTIYDCSSHVISASRVCFSPVQMRQHIWMLHKMRGNGILYFWSCWTGWSSCGFWTYWSSPWPILLWWHLLSQGTENCIASQAKDMESACLR